MPYSWPAPLLEPADQEHVAVGAHELVAIHGRLRNAGLGLVGHRHRLQGLFLRPSVATPRPQDGARVADRAATQQNQWIATLEQLAAWPVLDDRLGGVGQAQHAARPLIEQVRIEALRAQAADTALPLLALRCHPALLGLRPNQLLAPLHRWLAGPGPPGSRSSRNSR